MTVDGQDINFELYLAGDYQYILRVLGLKGARSNYACAWWKIHKTDRWKINNDFHSYNAPLLARTLKEFCEMPKQSTENYCCCDKQPLLNIPLDYTLVGELHVMLHVEDILIGNLVYEFLDWNKYDHFDSKKGDSKRVTSIKPD